MAPTPGPLTDKTPARAGSRNNSSIARPADDFYPTPRHAIDALLDRECFAGAPVWDPACGSGTICRALRARGYSTIGTNLRDRGYGLTGYDFLQMDWQRAPVIVCNPPFKAANRFVQHALFDLDLAAAAFLLRLSWLEGQNRHKYIFARRPPARVHVFAYRVIFYAGDTPLDEQPGWSDTAFAWFVWRRDHRGPTHIDWIQKEE